MNGYTRALDMQTAGEQAWQRKGTAGAWATLFDVQDVDGGGERMCRIAADSVRSSVPYFVRADISEALMTASETFPRLALQHDEPPGLSGFVVLERPLGSVPMDPEVCQRFGMPIDSLVPVGAYGWMHLPVVGPGECGYVLMSYVLVKGGVLDPFGLCGWTCGKDLPSGISSATYVEVDADGTGEAILLVHQWLRALWAFIDQKVVMERREMPDRATRRRAQREGRPEPVVRVIHLRRLESPPADNGSHAGREWQHSWLVSGHWRRQWYGSVRRHSPLWIAPYAKGDPSKPLKTPRKSVFAVVR